MNVFEETVRWKLAEHSAKAVFRTAAHDYVGAPPIIDSGTATTGRPPSSDELR
jgi:hypothetical protein